MKEKIVELLEEHKCYVPNVYKSIGTTTFGAMEMIKYDDLMKVLDKVFGADSDISTVDLETLGINNGDVVIVKVKGAGCSIGMETQYQMFAKSLRAMLDNNGKEACAVVLIGGDMEISRMDDVAMEKAGWMRKEKLEGLLDRMFGNE